jgi:hypothetical protein
VLRKVALSSLIVFNGNFLRVGSSVYFDNVFFIFVELFLVILVDRLDTTVFL